MADPTVYLAGPVAAYDDGGREWREWVKDQFPDIDFQDPLSKYNVPLEELSVRPFKTDGDASITDKEVVESDKRLLRESDAVLVGYSAVRSIGTPMEVMWARERNYPVALWIRDDTDIADLSPWYRYHAGGYSADIYAVMGHLLALTGGDHDMLTLGGRDDE